MVQTAGVFRPAGWYPTHEKEVFPMNAFIEQLIIDINTFLGGFIHSGSSAISDLNFLLGNF